MKEQSIKHSSLTSSHSDSCPDFARTDPPVSRKNLANQLNFIHFKDETILCRFDHPDQREPVWLSLKPLPTMGSTLVCLWPEGIMPKPFPEYHLNTIVIPGRETAINITPEIRAMTSRGFCIRLPEFASPVSAPYVSRSIFGHTVVSIRAESLSVTGNLADIRNNRITLNLGHQPDPERAGLVPGACVHASFETGDRALLAGLFTVIQSRVQGEGLVLTLEPSARAIHRFEPKKFRAQRFAMNPAPDVNFIHPLHGEPLTMTVCDLSGAGFSVENPGDKSALFTGLIIPELELNFAGAYSFRCGAQVVHHNAAKDGQPGRMTWGFAFTHMTLDDHLKLSGLLHQREDHHIRLCTALDEKSLWSFFFETGFIYAKKYHALMGDRHRIRDTYRKLYTRSPSIARHLAYRENGEILGHMSMLRLYRDAWLIHHHAALKRSSVKAGLAVLNHLAWFCYNSMWLEACHMRYMFCYFRPENAFPNYFFNGFAQRLNDPAGCSTDTLAYAIVRKPLGQTSPLPPGWSMDTAGAEDLAILADDYKTRSGGLMIEALDLSPDFPGSTELDRAFHDAGLKKDRRLVSLKHKGDLKAVIMVNVTDVAINMSDLSNCITVMMIEGQGLSREIISAALALLSGCYDQNRFPVLFYPLSVADALGITYQKEYILWILATRYSDHYFEFLEQVNRLGA